ncbi:MAG: amidohydrolase/deacetylase family metallohydrolase [Sediminibacterium sp.]|jgi:dihydroorotase|nr:amidohydrolase/deacetylase family metallohydrolase [Sediminibacterium sp.]
MKKVFISILCLITFFYNANAQSYSIVIKGGLVIDPKNGINEVMDIAIQDGKIASVAKNINATGAAQVVNAKGLIVAPGLIDIHGHVFAGTQPDRYLSDGNGALMPDGYTFRVGVTTIVDCGGAGWKNFPVFKKNVIDVSQTRVLSFLNIVGEGMRGGAYEQDARDMDPKMAAHVAKQNKKDIVGFKVAHFENAEWTPVDNAVAAGKLAGDIPVIVDFGGDDSHAPLSIEELFFKHLRPGDIYTHTFTELQRRDPIVDFKTRQLKPFIKNAQARGIVFDVGFGGASFAFDQALPAIKAGFYPNTISTDLHTGSMNNAMKDMLNVMSIFMTMGMDVPAIIKASTWAPAQSIKREELGNLTVGSVADVAILGIREGNFGFFDRIGHKETGTKKFECQATIRNGKMVYDLNGITTPILLLAK